MSGDGTIRVGIAGMSNIRGLDEAMKRPAVVLNADVVNGVAYRRDGYALHLAMPAPHSLFGGAQCMLCASGDACSIFDLTSGEPRQIHSYSGNPDVPVSYAETGEYVYFGNRQFIARYAPARGGAAEAVGLAVPAAPVLIPISSAGAALPAGTYLAALTKVGADGKVGGASDVQEIAIEPGEAIRVIGRKADELVWMSEPNGDVLFRAGPADTITTPPQTSEPLPTRLCHDPAGYDFLLYAFGRLWGALGSCLFYSEVFRPDLFRDSLNFFEFGQPITLLALAPDGIFVGGERDTFALVGTSPAEMRQVRCGAGSVGGSLCYLDTMSDLSSTIMTAENVQNSVPCWLTLDGLVTGRAGGQLFNLTAGKVDLGRGMTRAASLFRRVQGVSQVLVAYQAFPDGSREGDAMKNGQLFSRPNPDAGQPVSCGGVSVEAIATFNR